MISRYTLRALLLLAVLFALIPQRSFAQTRVDDGISTAEDVAIAFFHAAGSNPDFEKWAKAAPEFKRKSATRAPEFLYEEEQRLMKLWRDYDPARDLITIKASVDVELKAVQNKDGNEDYWMYITFKEGQATYFPFVYRIYKFAIIPQMIENLMMQQITKEQYDMMRADFIANSMMQRANLYVQLKPVKAYVNQPYTIDNVEQWALLADVVALTMRSQKTDAIFWNYGAKWYVSPVTKELRDLYKAPSSDGSLGN